ncbi:hypothetical protein K469DRAFT_735217 [Zopfia rhizophila CBS 207.26]|uniref:Uncharacterized protein n=1 Tax=Zopfia rhizophila CBS 207.26 TaxID=1314779 RepID=A0A6A6EQ36_9PEZI|nr:hypothetical protein K469DRAFT_735217 [Zopfia rhizophila CBS 207.26]
MVTNGPIPQHKRAHRIGGWLPRDRAIICDSVSRIVKHSNQAQLDLVLVVQDLATLVYGNLIVYMLFAETLTEVPHFPPYNEDPSLQPEIRDVPTLLKHDQFPDPESDKSPASIQTVTTAEGGWLSAAAQSDPNSPGLKDFLKTYVVLGSNDIHYGFTNLDQFLTRKFLPDARPTADPQDSHVIVSAAESTPFYIQTNDQHYSLSHLIGDSGMAAKFVGGTVYQAFLGADSYHTWHAPVSGKCLKQPTIIPGTYYPDKPGPAPDAAADARSQGYISCVAKRGVALIQPDDPTLGLIALVMIGMAGVSSIEFDNLDHFDKGTEIGRFHFGGSTHCLVFKPGVTFEPEPNAIPVDPTHTNIDQPPVNVCSKLGTLSPVEKH